jgi:hypothetical protein
VHGDNCAKLYFDRNEGNAMRSNLGTFATALLASAFATTAWSQGLGRANFETSCTPLAQEKFDRGLAMVHSFFYPDSVQAFTEAAAADAQCARLLGRRDQPSSQPDDPAADLHHFEERIGGGGEG